MDEEKRHVAFRESLNRGNPKPSDDSDEENGGVVNPSWRPSDGGTGPPAPPSDEEDDTHSPPTQDPERKVRSRMASRYDGPDLNVKFTRWREAVVWVCLVFYISDLLLDTFVLVTFVKATHIRQAWFMGFCMIIPNLYAGYKSLQWYLRAHQDHPVTSPGIWLIRIMFFPVSLILRYYDTLRRGYAARAAEKEGNKPRQRRIMEQFVSESAEVAMLRLFVIFLEDAPICVLNLTHVFATRPEKIDYVGYSVGVVVAKLSCSITLGVLHYAAITKLAWHACYQMKAFAQSGKKAAHQDDGEPGIPRTRSSMRGLRASASRTNSNPPTLALTAEEFHKRATLSPLAHLLFYFWQFTTIGSRLVCYSLFFSVLHLWLLVLASVRWVINTVCILVDVRNMSLANCASFGGVYLFTFVSTSTDRQYIRLAVYYTANIIEMTGVSVVWWTNSYSSPYHELGFGLLVGGTLVSVVFMLLYYSFGHPNYHNTWGWQLCNKKNKDTVESTNM